MLNRSARPPLCGQLSNVSLLPPLIYIIYILESQKTLGTRLRIKFSRGCLPFTTNSGEFRLGCKSMVNIFGVRPTGKFPRTKGNSGRFPFRQNVWKYRLGKKWKTFRRFVPLGNFRKSGKSKKVSPFLIFFVCLVSVRLLLSSMAVLYHVNG